MLRLAANDVVGTVVKFDCPSMYRTGTVSFNCTEHGWERVSGKCAGKL